MRNDVLDVMAALAFIPVSSDYALACRFCTVILRAAKNARIVFYTLTRGGLCGYGTPNSSQSPGRVQIVSKPELGTKHLCPGCGTKFYDLNKTPATCPKCGTVASLAPKGSSRAAAKATASQAAKKAEVEDEEDEIEVVSLEDADAEQVSASAKMAGLDDDEDEEDDDTLDGGDDADDTFLEEDDEDDAVPGIVVSRDDDEEI